MQDIQIYDGQQINETIRNSPWTPMHYEGKRSTCCYREIDGMWIIDPKCGLPHPAR